MHHCIYTKTVSRSKRTGFDLLYRCFALADKNCTWMEALLCGSYINVRAPQFRWLSFFLVMRGKFEFHILDKNETSYQFILYAANMETCTFGWSFAVEIIFWKRSEHKFLALPRLCLNTHKTGYRTQGLGRVVVLRKIVFRWKWAADFWNFHNVLRDTIFLEAIPRDIVDKTHQTLARNEREGNVFYFNV